MRRMLTLFAVCVVAGGVMTTPLLAQKTAPAVTRDSDRDGVPDTRDRCRGTAAGVRVDANGCPATAAPAPQAAAAPTTAAPAATTAPAPGRGLPVPATAAPAPSTAAAAPTTSPPAGAAGAAGVAAQAQTPGGAAPAPATSTPATTQTSRPGGLPSPAAAAPAAAAPAAGGGGAAPAGALGAVAAAAAPSRGGNPPTTAQPAPTTAAPAPAAAAPAAAAAAQPRPVRTVSDPSLTAGFWLPAYSGSTDADLLEYARAMTIRLDSAINALVDVFRNTTGAPVIGATGPNILSTREKGRWQRCRLIHFDLGTLGEGTAFLKDTTISPTLDRATAGLGDAFEGETATSECDNVVSMIEAPERWAPFQQNYETSAQSFYRDWYGQLRTLHEANRVFARALNVRLPEARQFPIFPALPPTPPTIGAVR